MEFVENPGKEKWTTYRGIAKTGDDIEKKALDLIKSGALGGLLPNKLVLIYME